MSVIVEDTYIFFDFIDTEKALGLLNRRTGAQFTASTLFKFAEIKRLNVYVNCSHKEGKTFHWDGLPAKASGMSRLYFPSLYLEPPQAFPYQLALWGAVIIQPPDHPAQHVMECLWYAEVEGMPSPQFKPSEIEMLASFLNGEVPDAAAASSTEPKPSHLLVIAALLELLKAPVEPLRVRGMNQAAIKMEILERFPLRGLGDRTLQDTFAAANKAMNEAKKDTA